MCRLDRLGRSRHGDTWLNICGVEKAGVEFLPLELGASVGAALALSSEVGEVLVAGELGRFEDLDPCSVAHRETETVHPQWCFEVDPRQSRGLKDHAINGTPVLPGVVRMEWMLRHAEAVLGQSVSVVEDVSFHAPLKFFGMEPVEITIGAEPTKNRELTVSLSSVRTLKMVASRISVTSRCVLLLAMSNQRHRFYRR